MIVKLTGIVLTFHFVCLAWIFFRARDIHSAIDMIGNILRFEKPSLNMTTPAVAGILLAGFILHFLPGSLFLRTRELFVKMPALVQASVLAVVSTLMFAVASGGAAPFIYFQF